MAVTPAERAGAVRQGLLYFFNFEVSSPRRRDFVNPAFHLIDKDDRERLAAALTARAKSEGLDPETYWQNLMAYWVFDPAIIADEAALMIKAIGFHRLVNPANRPAPPPSSPDIDGESRKRAFRARSRKGAPATATGGWYLGHRQASSSATAPAFSGRATASWSTSQST